MGGTIRDRYESQEVVGRGGQGEVHRALDRQHDRTVALKIRSVVDRDRRTALEEARALLSLDPHPLLPLVRDDFFVDGRHVIVMDWVQGRDLGRLLREQSGQDAVPPFPAGGVGADAFTAGRVSPRFSRTP